MSYTGELSNPAGLPYRSLDNIVSLEFARSFGNVGEMRITVPDDMFDPALIKRNWRIKLFRHIPQYAPILVGKTVWFVRAVEWNVITSTISLRAQDALGLLKDRIVAYTPQTTYADKTDEEFPTTPYADNSMHDYLRENFGSSALDAARDASAHLIIPVNKSFGAQVNKEAAWQDILSVLQDLSKMSTQMGVPILYDVTVNENGVFVFNTWIGRRGRDRTSLSTQPHVFSPDRNNLAELTVTWDYTEEKNAIYIGGYDSGGSRVVATVVDNSRVRQDPFARAETFIDGGDSDLDAVLQDIGSMSLEGFRPILRVEAMAVETPESTYGVHYDYADTVSVMARGMDIPCDISAISGSFADGKDTVALRLSGQRQI